MTIRLEGPVERLSLQLSNEALQGFYDSTYGFDMNPPYQRGDVWPLEKRINLIYSFLRWIPVGAVTVNHRPGDMNSSDHAKGHVVDGKQRITTIQMFTAGKFEVPAVWFPRDQVGETRTCYVEYSEFEGVAWPNLGIVAQRKFGLGTMGIYHSHLPGIPEERGLYQLINFGGVPQTEEDRARAAQYERRFDQAADHLLSNRGLSLWGAIAAAAGNDHEGHLLLRQFMVFMGHAEPRWPTYEFATSKAQQAADLRRAAAEVYR